MKKNLRNIIIYVFAIVMFIWGAIFVAKHPIENKTDNNKESFIRNHCPTMMVRKGQDI